MALQTNWEIIITFSICQVTVVLRAACDGNYQGFFLEPWKVLACCMRSCVLSSRSHIETLIAHMTSAKIILLGITLQRRQNIHNSAWFDLFWENEQEYLYKKYEKNLLRNCAQSAYHGLWESGDLEVFAVSKQNCWRNRLSSLSVWKWNNEF